MTSLEPPSDFDRSQKKQFRTTVKNLIDVGLDPASRLDQVREFVRLTGRLVELRKGEAAAGMPGVRATNTATSELRRLRDSLLARFGPAGWSPLCYATHHEWIADDARLTRLAGDNRLASHRTTQDGQHPGP